MRVIIPKRFYKRTKDGKKVLQIEESRLMNCIWCGTCFVKEDTVVCSRYCRTMADFWDML